MHRLNLTKSKVPKTGFWVLVSRENSVLKYLRLLVISSDLVTSISYINTRFKIQQWLLGKPSFPLITNIMRGKTVSWESMDFKNQIIAKYLQLQVIYRLLANNSTGTSRCVKVRYTMHVMIIYNNDYWGQMSGKPATIVNL